MRWGRIILVIFGALIITALGIDAADTINGSQGTLLSQVIGKDAPGKCPLGMVEIQNMQTLTCVDVFEASPGPKCPEQNPEQMVASLRNMDTKECAAESKKEAMPWRFVTRDQAMQLCARSGKRLPTSEEWYALSLGMVTPEKSCNVTSKSVNTTGSSPECVSPNTLHDLVGNVWEWVSDDVIQGTYKNMKLPGTGYVSQVDAGGMATQISNEPQDLFEKDYFWSRDDGAYGIIRGGYYDSGTDAGVYSVHADTLPTTASAGIGFRCVI